MKRGRNPIPADVVEAASVAEIVGAVAGTVVETVGAAAGMGAVDAAVADLSKVTTYLRRSVSRTDENVDADIHLG